MLTKKIKFTIKKRTFVLKIYQLFLLILAFSLVVTGITYAYFMTSSFIKNKITGNMATVDAKLTVERVTVPFLKASGQGMIVCPEVLEKHRHLARYFRA